MTILRVAPDQTWKFHSVADGPSLVSADDIRSAIRIGGNGSNIVMWFNYVENLEVDQSYVNVGASILYSLYSRFSVAGFVSSYEPRHSSSYHVTVTGNAIFTGDYLSSKGTFTKPLTDDDVARVCIYFNMAKGLQL